jgi:hypothetical protein
LALVAAVRGRCDEHQPPPRFSTTAGLATAPRDHARGSLECEAARCGKGVVPVRVGPFGSVGAMDGAAAAYMDILAAVPKGLTRAGTALGTVTNTGEPAARAAPRRRQYAVRS